MADPHRSFEPLPFAFGLCFVALGVVGLVGAGEGAAWIWVGLLVTLAAGVLVSTLGAWRR